MKSKFYVIWKGKKTGIFTSWDECKQYVSGVPGAKYKAFSTRAEANIALKSGWEAYYNGTGKKSGGQRTSASPSHYNPESISVDAACSGNPGPMEYKGVSTKTGETIFHFGPITGTNNIGEFLAIVHGLGYLKERQSNMPIYSDSQTAIKWVNMKKANTSLAKTKATEQVWSLISRAEKWLAENTYSNQIMKWETEHWGEIKADFGRK
ncbi:ribonuclease H family protein [Caldibacillus lycopersici]|uniref:Ribonuclease H n=1 Tax=Perspicuibacillus lycopersici TaxID=1325689 RepID=A0AAE3ISU6_9BACI|nr:ribonuclease H family protein [Perspicuibacillus lycopersici]MCU9613562.1 ribonuclease H family protein [Perspicuibacillus lycopersici]